MRQYVDTPCRYVVEGVGVHENRRYHEERQYDQGQYLVRTASYNLDRQTS